MYEHFYISVPNPDGQGTHRVGVYQWGESSGDAVVCVHGLTRNARDFDFLARHLAQRHRVLCIDVAGRGSSDRYENREWYGYPAYAADIFYVLRHLEIEKVKWVGTSMGGIIGMVVAALNPDVITRMVLNDVGYYLPLEPLLRIAAYVGVKNTFHSEDEYRVELKKILRGFGIKSAEHWLHAFEHSAERVDNGVFAMRYDPAIAYMFRHDDGTIKLTEAADLSKIWGAVKCDTLLLRGTESDLFLEETAQQMVASRRNVQLINYAGVGHAPSLMEDNQISDVARFLF